MVKRTGDVPVSLRALIQRINRKLAAEGQMLKASRGLRALTEVGDYYVIDCNRNILMLKWVNVEALATKLGVLKEWERLAEK